MPAFIRLDFNNMIVNLMCTDSTGNAINPNNTKDHFKESQDIWREPEKVRFHNELSYAIPGSSLFLFPQLCIWAGR